MAVNWHGNAVAARLKAELGRRLDAAAILVEGRAKELLSVEGTSKAEKTHVLKSGRKIRKGSLMYGTRPSNPGEPPRLQTGRLRGSVAHERQGLRARVGTNVKYGRFLELGVTFMAPRPWLRRALAERTAAVRALVGRPVE